MTPTARYSGQETKTMNQLNELRAILLASPAALVAVYGRTWNESVGVVPAADLAARLEGGTACPFGGEHCWQVVPPGGTQLHLRLKRSYEDRDGQVRHCDIASDHFAADVGMFGGAFEKVGGFYQ